MFEKEIRRKAKELLEAKTVDLVIGYTSGSLPFQARPILVSSPEDVGKLVWNHFARSNLARYLLPYRDSSKKIALLAKGCDARAVAVLLQEEQFPRERIHIIGLPCPGVISRRKLEEKLGEIKEEDFSWEENSFLFQGEKWEVRPFLEDTCARCRYPNPPLYDELIGEEKEPWRDGSVDYLKELDNQSREERWQFFAAELSRCIRCYACRNACPLCYCKECFAESDSPRWVNGVPTLSDNLFFHLGRSMHLAGRCVECGACERACPEEIKIGLLPLKVEEIVRENFSFEAGLSLEEEAPLLTYKESDPGEFIK
ncbi:MAG: hypothetical protein PWP04_349 [Candidatus Atribacteria bacterium]|nr:hypothetical protein [Candidatus Atribacteria bacterium]